MMREILPGLTARLEWFLNHRPGSGRHSFRAGTSRARENGSLLSLLRGHRMKALSRGCSTKPSFFPDYGVRALSHFHARTSVRFEAGGPDI